MKYIILASLLSSAALAAPFAQRGAGNANAGTGTQAGTQAGTGNVPQGQAQGQTPTGQQGQAGTAAQQQGQANGQTQNAPQQGAGIANGQTPTAGDLATAVSNWMADTSMVSNFLNTGAAMTNNVAFKQAATVAFNAEVDELTHKAIIEQGLPGDQTLAGANSTLATGGAFQDVVDKLQEMSVKGRAAVQNIDLINQNRCVNVLPNIDAYMAATGSSSQAVRPAVCDQTGVAGGVQGNGPTQVGQAPGTPQAAFTAAQQLAAGTGNGVVQNGAPAGGAAAGTAGTAGTAQGQAPAQGQTPAGTAAQGQTPAQGQQAGAANGQQAGAANGQQAGAANGQQAGAAQGQTGAANGQQAGAAQGQATQQQAGAAGAATQ